MRREHIVPRARPFRCALERGAVPSTLVLRELCWSRPCHTAVFVLQLSCRNTSWSKRVVPTSTAARPRLRTVLAVMVRRSSAASLLSVSRELAIALRSVSFGGGGCSVPLYSSSDRYSALSASRFACDSCRNLCAADTRFSVVAARLAASTSATLVLVLVLERAEVVIPHILGLLARDGVHQLNAVARRFPGTKALSRAPLVVQLQPPPVHRRHSSCRQPPTADSPLLSLIRALVIPFTTVLKTVG